MCYRWPIAWLDCISFRCPPDEFYASVRSTGKAGLCILPRIPRGFALVLGAWLRSCRVSILRNKILNVANYKGDPLRFPDVATVQSAIEAFSERPIAFGMDWGITAAGQTLLVEVNDGYALGNIGLSGMPYTAMIEARWRELMGLPDNGVGDCFTI